MASRRVHSPRVRIFDLHVRGEIPSAMEGMLIVTTSRRHKDRFVFSRWHDSQADLMKIELFPGHPGRARVSVLPFHPDDVGLPGGRQAGNQALPYVGQPNHGLNVADGTVWATNLLFGAPVEVDVATWRPRRILRCVDPDEDAPRMSSTSHFAWSLDRRYAYLHQSLLEKEDPSRPVRSREIRLVELDTKTGSQRVWTLLAPPEDDLPEAANFHSAFYFEEQGGRFVGLLRTGAVLESLDPHGEPGEHLVSPMPASTVWIASLDDSKTELQCEMLPGIRELDGLALSHLDVDNSSGEGFVLYANFKEADVAEETHGINLYAEQPSQVIEHYSGMIIEAMNYGQVIRYEQRNGKRSLKVFKRGYDCGRTSLGHTWLPINIELDASREHLFCSFAGFHPRLLPKHVADAYPGRVVDPEKIRYVPPLLMRFDARTLKPAYGKQRDYLSYAEPMAMCVVGAVGSGFVCTFSPEVGLRIYRAEDLSSMMVHAVAANLLHWKDTHFRPDPAHMVFLPR